MIVDSNVHRTSQTQPIVHEQVVYEDAPVQEIIEEAAPAPEPFHHEPMAPMGAPMGQEPHAPAHNGEGNNLIIGAMAVRRGDDVDDMEAPAPEEPAAPENLGRGTFQPKPRDEDYRVYPRQGEPSVAGSVGGEPSEDVQAAQAEQPEKRRKKRGKKKRSRGLPRLSRGNMDHP